mgnify:CR=1 FL=1
MLCRRPSRPPERVTVQSSDEGYVVEAFIPGSVLDAPDWKLSAGESSNDRVLQNAVTWAPIAFGIWKSPMLATAAPHGFQTRGRARPRSASPRP